MKCKVLDCHSDNHKAKGYCPRHYKKFLKYGDPLAGYSRKKNGFGCITRDGYKLISVNGKNVLEHRYVYENFYQTKLNRNQIIHHIDGNGLNNEITNLELLDSQSEHISIHNKERNFKKFLDLGETSELKHCPKCNTTKSITEFHKNPHHRRGYHTYCKICKKSYGGKNVFSNWRRTLF